MSRLIKILLIDDHILFRESLSRLLQAEPDLEIVGTSAGVAEGLRLIDLEKPDVVLLDYDLGEDHGLSLLAKAKAKKFQGAVLMVTAGIDNAATLRVLQEGASGIFLKHSPPSRLIAAIHQVVEGETWLDKRAMQSALAGASESKEEERALRSPTVREREVLQGVLDGLSNKEIASRLSVSESSVKATLQQLFDKTGVRTRSQLVRIVLEKHSGDWLKTSR
ncbi:MAG TPA: response regulator transcription factor [Acidobacteriaceae bacterium]|jgi:DNA-binding NarL/FixJ family response regulator|nr:response regulator transcription factor [Acidobacteriaceae bacterium]